VVSERETRIAMTAKQIMRPVVPVTGWQSLEWKSDQQGRRSRPTKGNAPTKSVDGEHANKGSNNIPDDQTHIR
jgi:hypothetical protein